MCMICDVKTVLEHDLNAVTLFIKPSFVLKHDVVLKHVWKHIFIFIISALFLNMSLICLDTRSQICLEVSGVIYGENRFHTLLPHRCQDMVRNV